MSTRILIRGCNLMLLIVFIGLCALTRGFPQLFYAFGSAWFLRAAIAEW